MQVQMLFISPCVGYNSKMTRNEPSTTYTPFVWAELVTFSNQFGFGKAEGISLL